MFGKEEDSKGIVNPLKGDIESLVEFVFKSRKKLTHSEQEFSFLSFLREFSGPVTMSVEKCV